ncbi:MAG: metallophosphoesterase [Planctomycetota bacterium]
MTRRGFRVVMGATLMFWSSVLGPQALVADEKPATSEKTDSADADRLSVDQVGSKPESSPVIRRSGSSDWGVAYDAPQAVIREPSQGRPIFKTPGDVFYFVMHLTPDVSGDVSLSLQHALEPNIRVSLRATTPPSIVNDTYCTLVLEIPSTTEPGLYDLEVRTGTASHYARRSVKVLRAFKDKFRFVHLSNMNIGDLTAPDFDDMLPREINLLAPEFIIATGDYTEWARAKDDAASWLRVLSFFERFNAPVFMLCGLHDHQESFTRYVANKPIGEIDYGQYHGLLLLDHPGNPIYQDLEQLSWISENLKSNRNKRFNFIAMNSDELGLLDTWRERGDLQAFIKANRVKMFIVGGSTDWDYREFADKLAGLDDFHFIRTHEASTSLRDRAKGFSHYRVIEVDGDKVSYVYHDDTTHEKLQHSIPTGRLRAFYDAPNDGTARRVSATVQNALNQAFEDVHVWLRVAKRPGERKPEVAPGKVLQVLDAGDHWACNVAIDLPDKGAVRVMASADPSDIPPVMPIEVALEGATRWAFSPKSTNFGLSYYTCDSPVSLKLTNTSQTPQSCYPVVCVNGTQLHANRSVCPRLPIALEPGKSMELPIDLTLRRVSEGPHELQVYFLEDPLSRLHNFDIALEMRQQVSGDFKEPTEGP